MSNLTELPNIGTELAKRLELIGVNSKEKLFALGTEKVFIKLKTIYPDACHSQLYAIEGAIQGIRWHKLTDERKNELKEFFRISGL